MVDPASARCQVRLLAFIVFPSGGIRALISSDSAAAPSARRLSVYVHPMSLSFAILLLRMWSGPFIRLNVGSEIYHLEAADPSGAAS